MTGRNWIKLLFLATIAISVVLFLFIIHLLVLFSYILGGLLLLNGCSYVYIAYREKHRTRTNDDDVATWAKTGVASTLTAIPLILSPLKQFPGIFGFILSLILDGLVGIPVLFLEIVLAMRTLQLVWHEINSSK